MSQRHLKVAVSDVAYWGITATAAERGASAAMIFAELVDEALRARALGIAPSLIPDNPVAQDTLIAAGAEGMSFPDFEEHLRSLGWMCWIEEKIEAGNESA